MNAICFYESPYYLFSNFSAHALLWEGVLYPTAEHAYQCSKFSDPAIHDEVRSAKSPFACKRIKERYRERALKRSEGDKVRIMEGIVRAKVSQHDDVREALLQTGDALLVEDSPDDAFWGWGPDRMGSNHMGKILMRIRDDVRRSGQLKAKG